MVLSFPLDKGGFFCSAFKPSEPNPHRLRVQNTVTVQAEHVCSLWKPFEMFYKKKKMPGFTQDVQLDLRGLLASAVCGHTCVSALIIKLGLLDPEGCCVFDPDRKSIVKPRDLGARLSLRHTGQSHSLTNQSLQHGGAWLDPRLC